MSHVFEVQPGAPEQVAGAVEEAARALRAGELVVFPTETVYGIAARPDHPPSTARLFAAKRRPAGLALPVLAPTPASALDLVVPNEAAERLAATFWPGPLTLVLPRSERSRAWHLGEARASIGVRVPDHALSLALLELAGPLATTSANLSGAPPLEDGDALIQAFGESVAVYLVLGPGFPRPTGGASSVLDLTGDTPRVLREGPLDHQQVLAVAGEPDTGRTA